MIKIGVDLNPSASFFKKGKKGEEKEKEKKIPPKPGEREREKEEKNEEKSPIRTSILTLHVQDVFIQEDRRKNCPSHCEMQCHTISAKINL